MIQSDQLNSILEEAKELVETKVELEKLKAAEKFSGFSARLLTGFIVAAIFLVFFILFSLFLGLALGKLFQSSLHGFGALSLFYLILFLIAYRFRKLFIRIPIQNKIIQSLFQNESED